MDATLYTIIRSHSKAMEPIVTDWHSVTWLPRDIKAVLACLFPSSSVLQDRHSTRDTERHRGVLPQRSDLGRGRRAPIELPEQAFFRTRPFLWLR